MRVNTSLDILLKRCGASELFYFGDLDARGVVIGAGAAQRRAGRKAAPLTPAATFYSWLLAHGRVQWSKPKRRRRLTPSHGFPVRSALPSPSCLQRGAGFLRSRWERAFSVNGHRP